MGYNTGRHDKALTLVTASGRCRNSTRPGPLPWSPSRPNGARDTSGWRAGAWVVSAVLVLVMAACGGEELKTVRGAVVDVQESAPFQLSSLDVQDGNGTVWHFEAREFEGFSPPHLREHMVQGLRVSVTYREDGGALVVVAITD